MIPRSLAFFAILCFFSGPVFAGEAEEIEAILTAQAEAWSAGDIEGFMEGYWKSDELRFASGGTVTYGWQQTLDNYKARYSTREKMGKLTFRDFDIQILSENYALVFGRFELDRKVGNLAGLFTLLFEKRPEGWRIIADHSSENPLPQVVLGEGPDDR